MSIFRKLGWFFRQEKKHYLIGVFSLFAVALVQLVPPKVIGIINKDHFRVDLPIDYRCFFTISFSLYLADEYLGKCSSVGERTSAAVIQTFYRNGQSLLPKISDWGFDGSCNE